MATTMQDIRRHPDIFTAQEAAAYLALESVRSLETLRKDASNGGFGLVGHKPAGKSFLYTRKELNRVAMKMFGELELVGTTAKGQSR